LLFGGTQPDATSPTRFSTLLLSNFLLFLFSLLSTFAIPFSVQYRQSKAMGFPKAETTISLKNRKYPGPLAKFLLSWLALE
ncbi:hypothetical protein EDB80DRAFT_730931, partial [Ilyonectria destructans]